MGGGVGDWDETVLGVEVGSGASASFPPPQATAKRMDATIVRTTVSFISLYPVTTCSSPSITTLLPSLSFRAFSTSSCSASSDRYPSGLSVTRSMTLVLSHRPIFCNYDTYHRLVVNCKPWATCVPGRRKAQDRSRYDLNPFLLRETAG